MGTQPQPGLTSGAAHGNNRDEQAGVDWMTCCAVPTRLNLHKDDVTTQNADATCCVLAYVSKAITGVGSCCSSINVI